MKMNRRLFLTSGAVLLSLSLAGPSVTHAAKRIAATVKRYNPKINFSLEMMARNPLKVPCLTDKYWATFPQRSGRYLARALNWVKKHSQKLHNMDSMSQQRKAEFEQENFRTSIAYARDQLGMV